MFLIRTLLTIILLVLVWQNSHWSVALTLTLVTLSLEFIGFTLRKMIGKDF